MSASRCLLTNKTENYVPNFKDKFSKVKDEIGNEYELIDEIGSGGFGSVFQAKRISDDKIFAMKKDSPLIVGVGNSENYLASDIPAISPF